MKTEYGNVRMGLRDGAPIGIGYFPISFAFGIFAVNSGLGIFETLFISMFNLTSAGQMAAIPIISAAGSYIELALSQLVINARYTLMSLSLSQRVGRIGQRDKFLLAFALTDEQFAVFSSRQAPLSRKYLYSLIVFPYLGWTLGTLCGALAGNILPERLTSALGIAIYAMFIAIIVPAAKKRMDTLVAIVCAIALSYAFKYVPVLNKVPSGFSIIICSVFAAVLMTLVSLRRDERGTEQ